MKNLYKYIKEHMKDWSGNFTMAVTDMSEIEPGCILISIAEANDNVGTTTQSFYAFSDATDEPMCV